MNKYSFKDVLSKEILIEDKSSEYTNVIITFQKVEIPKIQRDYAQGRDSEVEVRKRFLDSIFNALRNNKSLDMDFIYGSVLISPDQRTNTFILLDGQQRLTTLFLLYWYIGSRELSENKFNELKNSLIKFTYSTRISSREFCKKLVETKFLNNESPKKEIINSSWFFQSYEKDPTVKSMLNMLDFIHEKYNETISINNSLFENLQNLQFYILPLNGFSLSEELYVKMNARGKQLTDFENFKADLINWMQDEKNQYQAQFHKLIELNHRKVPYYHSYSQKIDNSWTNFFWDITKNYSLEERGKNGNLLYPDGKITDPLFMKLFYRYFLNKYILQSKIDRKEIDKNNDYRFLVKESKYQNFDSFKYVLSESNIIINFENFFDTLSLNWAIIENSIQPCWQKDDKKWSFLDDTITLVERVAFLGISLYLEQNNSFNEDTFNQWMRIVWNLIENTDIDSVNSMLSIMHLINELSLHSNNIYEFLADRKNVISAGSSKGAIEEERKKSFFIINKERKWEEAFIAAEKHIFFKGSIGFLMTDEMSIDEFLHRKNMACLVFDGKGVNATYRKNGHIFLRALISQFKKCSDILKQNFIDVDEKEHYLKKMLASNEVVRKFTQELFSLKDENKLNGKLLELVAQDSQIPGWNKNDTFEKLRIKRAHEALYKEPSLQNWMQQEGAIYFDWRWTHLYIRRERSWYDWVMLDTARNDVITYILSKGFTTEHQIQYLEDKASYYCGNDNIVVSGQISEYELNFIFDRDKDLLITVKSKENSWIEIATYDYLEEDIGLKQLLEEEIFNKDVLKSKILKPRSNT